MIVRQWIRETWFRERSIEAADYEDCMKKICWNGSDIRELAASKLELRLVGWGLDRGYAASIAADVMRARGFEVGSGHVREKRQG
jgi:hypothetical protein